MTDQSRSNATAASDSTHSSGFARFGEVQQNIGEFQKVTLDYQCRRTDVMNHQRQGLGQQCIGPDLSSSGTMPASVKKSPWPIKRTWNESQRLNR